VDDVEGGSALIMRCHHCIADGTAMMILIQKLYDPAPGAPPLQAPRPRGKSLKQADKGLLAPAINAVTGAARGALALGAGAGMLVGELLRGRPPSPLKGEFAPAKRVAWSEPFPLPTSRRSACATAPRSTTCWWPR
jgi:diacylglycerol O-acyltransferase